MLRFAIKLGAPSVSKDERMAMEQKEATMWKELALTPADAPNYKKLHTAHKQYFDFLERIEHSIPKIDELCVTCGKKAKAKCCACKEVAFCGTKCQRAAWRSSHKIDCRNHADAMAFAKLDAETYSVSRPHQILLLLSHERTLLLRVSKETIMDFALFAATVKAAAPLSVELETYAWQFWQTVRVNVDPHTRY